MKVLLVNPPNNHLISAPVPEYISESYGYLPPLGLLSIGTYLKENSNHELEIFDALVEKASYAEIAKRAANFDLIGITTITFFLIDVVKVVAAIRKIRPEIPIVIGGPHVVAFPQASLDIPGVTYAMTGECDKSFTYFVDALASEEPERLDKTPGLYRKVNGKVVANQVGDLIDDLDKLPLLNRLLIDYKEYHSILSSSFQDKGYLTTAFSSRGCPSKCTFCDRPHLGKIFRAQSAERVLEEIKQCIDLGINEIFYYDDTFTIDKTRVRKICQGIIDQGLSIKWDVRARVNTVNQSLLELMKQAGCSRIHFGVESGNQDILNLLQKGINKEQVRQAFANTKKVGIETLGYFMFGVPGESLDQMNETIDFSLELNPDYAHYAILTPFPATPLYLELLQNGQIDYDYWEEFARNPIEDYIPRFSPDTVSREELLSITEKAHKAFYLRPGYLFKQCIKVRSMQDFMTKFGVARRMIFSA